MLNFRRMCSPALEMWGLRADLEYRAVKFRIQCKGLRRFGPESFGASG